MSNEQEFILLPSLASRKGSARLEEAAALLGREAALLAAAKAGPYLLADSLVHGLRLEGAALPANGELKALSPDSWRPGVEGLPPGAEVAGVELDAGQLGALRAFLGHRPWPDSPSALLAIAERFFYEDSLKVKVRYTGPRFNPS